MPVLVTWGDRDGCEVSDGPDAVLSLTDASTILNDAALMHFSFHKLRLQGFCAGKESFA